MAERQTILVTGGAGLIGSHLIEALLKKGHRVVSLDNYFIGKEESHIEGAEYVKGHTRDIEKLLGQEAPATIYHLAEYSRVEQSFDDIALVWELNIEGTFRVLEYWRKRKCKLIYAGSSTKFADEGTGRNGSPYAWMKASNTDLVKNYGAWYGLDYAITYFYNNYGPRELADGPYASVIGRFKSLYEKGEPLTVVSPGTQKRNFTYVGDTVRALIDIGEKGHGDEYGIGSPEAYTLLELAKMFTENIVMLPERKGNRMSAPVDTSKIEKEFGWKPKMTVKQYVETLKKRIN